MEVKKSFVLYTATEAQLDMLRDDYAGMLIKAVFDYVRTGEVPDLPELPAVVFAGIRSYLDVDRASWEDTVAKRKKAANTRWNQNANASTSMHMHANASEIMQPSPHAGVYVSESVSDSVSVSESVGKSVTQEEPTPVPSPSPAKTPRGKFGHVLLADRELERLQELRPNDWEAKLQRLDDYIEQTGRSYNNHLLTIMSWAEEDDKKAPRPADTSVHFAQEAKNKGNYDGIFMDLFSDEAEEYIKGGNT